MTNFTHAVCVLAIASFCASPFFADESGNANDYFDADVAIKPHFPAFSLVTYASTGGGASMHGGDVLPLIEGSSGFQFAPWIAVGAFWAANPLSDFEHANFGLNLADREAAYGLMSGTEILLTPYASRMFHPLVRVAVGGISVGYLEDADAAEGYDSAVEDRFFFASLSAGAEMNLSRHLRLALRGGWRFAANDDTLGMEEGILSGPEVSLSVRALWRTVID